MTIYENQQAFRDLLRDICPRAPDRSDEPHPDLALIHDLDAPLEPRILILVAAAENNQRNYYVADHAVLRDMIMSEKISLETYDIAKSALDRIDRRHDAIAFAAKNLDLSKILNDYVPHARRRDKIFSSWVVVEPPPLITLPNGDTMPYLPEWGFSEASAKLTDRLKKEDPTPAGPYHSVGSFEAVDGPLPLDLLFHPIRIDRSGKPIPDNASSRTL
ncbi:MAG TPA: hypothetical protein VFR09_06620 [Alphaproteobacteria bacterium]|nr:hypothetical protein [Alphaproteobacteria bacterium]